MNNKLFYILYTLLAFTISSCSVDADSDIIQESDKTRISVYPSELQFLADGTTPEGQSELNAIITINPYWKKEASWQASLDDNNWLSIEQITVDSDGLIERGLKLQAQPNSEYTRKAILKITLNDGTEQEFDVVQLGEKADAYVNILNDVSKLDFMADDIQPQTVTFETNMDEYVIEVEEGVNWVSFIDRENNEVEIIVDENLNEEAFEREAKIYIRVGSPETSEAVAEITIRQFAPELFSFLWGSALPDYHDVAKAATMEKIEEGIYAIQAYFRNGTLRIGHYANTQRYPQFYLMENGQIGQIDESSDAEDQYSIPSIDVEGMRSLLINLNTMQYELQRISTRNSMPDHVLAEYPTQLYVARDGTMKEWIVSAIRWDGGDISPKLGGKLVPSAQSASGGYNATADLPTSILDPKLVVDYEEAENGGKLQGDDRFGRIYTFSEMLTGVARGGIDDAINQTFPVGWQAGDKVIDAVGNEVVIDYISNAMMTGDNDLDEANHPTLTWQVQGICPYGYHIANAQDWLDLAYAMSEKSAGDSYPVSKNEITYKQFMTTSQGITNMAAWLRNSTHWENAPIADGADEFGFNYFPTGFRYLKQGWQMYGLRKQVWVPLLSTDTKAFRINVVINRHNHTYADMRNVDNGNAILPFRCVRNYKSAIN